MPAKRPVTIRGIAYPGMTEAAKAYGVSVAAVYNACKRGTLDNVGTGRTGPLRRRVYIGGREWPSQAALAAHLGVSQPDVSAYFTVRRLIAAMYPGEDVQ